MAKRKPRTPFEELLEAAEHDARVTVWERTFVASIREQIEKRDQPWLSDQQSRVLARIGAEGPSVRKRTVATCTQCRGSGRMRDRTVDLARNRAARPVRGRAYCTQSEPPR